MKHLFVLVLVGAFATWEELGGSASGGGIASGPSDLAPALAVDSSGAPIVGWATADGLRFRRWNGATWDESVGPLYAAFATARPALARGPSGRLAAACVMNAWSPDGDVWLALNDGSGWSTQLNASTPDLLDTSFAPAVAVSPTNDVLVAWVAAAAGPIVPPVPLRQVRARLWTATGWTDLGTVNAAGDAVSPTVAFDGAVPAVAYTDNADGAYRVRVRRWIGGSWIDDPAIAASTGDAHSPTLAFDDSGAAIVAWTQVSPSLSEGSSILVRRLGAAGWSSLGGPVAADSAIPAHLALDSAGRPVVAWAGGGEIYVRAWNGSDWGAIDNVSATAGDSASPRIAWPDKRSNIAAPSCRARRRPINIQELTAFRAASPRPPQAAAG